jgi:hypothetical protein
MFAKTKMDSSFREFLAKIRLERWIEEWTLELIEGRQSDGKREE